MLKTYGKRLVRGDLEWTLVGIHLFHKLLSRLGGALEGDEQRLLEELGPEATDRSWVPPASIKHREENND